MSKQTLYRTFLIIALLIYLTPLPQSYLAFSLSSSMGVSSHGAIQYPVPHELGVWFVPEWANTFPKEATWVVTTHPYQESYAQLPSGISPILNWYWLHIPYTDGQTNTLQTADQLNYIESQLETIPTQNFWGILFIAEEHYREHIGFVDDLNTTWFGEALVGYPIYQQTVSGATRDQWMDEMYLRMLRGFYSYFHGKTRIGLTAGGPNALLTYLPSRGYAGGIPFYFGQPALDFIRSNYDFVVLYTYTRNLDDFATTKQYLQAADQLFLNQRKFWIATRIWPGENDQVWQQEALGLELKNCLDRNMVIFYQYQSIPSIDQVWPLMVKSTQLYDSSAPYFEEYVNGTNLLTGRVGYTYGWVQL